MSKPWFGRIICEGEGVVIEKEFKTKAEADAFCAGFVQVRSQR